MDTQIPASDNIHINSPYSRGEGAGRLDRGETHLAAPDLKEYKQRDRTNPFPTGGAYMLPGTQRSIHMDAFPIRDAQTLSRPMLPGNNIGDVLRRNQLIYRSDTTPRRDGPIMRALPASVTTPRSNAVFMDGTQGDHYGD